MIKSSCLLAAVVLLITPTCSVDQWGESGDSSCCDSPHKPGIGNRKRTNEALDDTPPSTPPGLEGASTVEGELKSRRQLALGELEEPAPSKAELNGLLTTLCETIFKERRSVAGNGVDAGKFYRKAMSEEGLTDTSLINKAINIVSLQCSLWNGDASVFSQRMETLRDISRDLDFCVEGSAKKHLIIVLVLIENSLFRKKCFDSLERHSLKRYCADISSRLGDASSNTDEERHLRTCLVKSGHLIMEICDGFKSALSPEDRMAAQQLKEVLTLRK